MLDATDLAVLEFMGRCVVSVAPMLVMICVVWLSYHWTCLIVGSSREDIDDEWDWNPTTYWCPHCGKAHDGK